MEFLFQSETYSQLADRFRESSDDADLFQVPLLGKFLHAEVSIARQAKPSYFLLENIAICPKSLHHQSAVMQQNTHGTYWPTQRGSPKTLFITLRYIDGCLIMRKIGRAGSLTTC